MSRHYTYTCNLLTKSCNAKRRRHWERQKNKQTTTAIGLISKKNNFARENTFLYISLPLLFHDYKRETFYVFAFFFTAAHFHLTGR